ncbi:GNAT family N-acetyltransferase [Methanolobus psychrotolerans]|uniref:GNAT family N-acetyltransferase n=1 Tax=Methanolobus psychrotolerans TaxID=1874706 RepID=UPI000B919256|nr:GNAT family N-acetyltransferase [Methanolobus psychrotolerans]
MQTKWTKGYEDFGDAYHIHKNVFVIEQNIDEECEIDEYDAIALHLVVYDNEVPVATGRLFEHHDSFVIGRICVIKEYRNIRLGSLLMEMLIEEAITRKAKELYLSSQVYATGFYKKFGFSEYGDIYREAGIEHIAMVRKN